MKANFLRWSCKETKAEKVTGPVFSDLVFEETDTAGRFTWKVHEEKPLRLLIPQLQLQSCCLKQTVSMSQSTNKRHSTEAWQDLRHQTEGRTKQSKAKGTRGPEVRGAPSLLREIRKRNLKWVRELQMAVLCFWVTKATGTGLRNPVIQLCFPHSLKANQMPLQNIGAKHTFDLRTIQWALVSTMSFPDYRCISIGKSSIQRHPSPVPMPPPPYCFWVKKQLCMQPRTAMGMDLISEVASSLISPFFVGGKDIFWECLFSSFQGRQDSYLFFLKTNCEI